MNDIFCKVCGNAHDRMINCSVGNVPQAEAAADALTRNCAKEPYGVFENHVDIMNAAREKWGRVAQIIKAIEEMAELTKELCKIINTSDGNREKIIDEIADVRIMIIQMELIFNATEKEILDRIEYKMNRLIEKIKG